MYPWNFVTVFIIILEYFALSDLCIDILIGLLTFGVSYLTFDLILWTFDLKKYIILPDWHTRKSDFQRDVWR